MIKSQEAPPTKASPASTRNAAPEPQSRQLSTGGDAPLSSVTREMRRPDTRRPAPPAPKVSQRARVSPPSAAPAQLEAMPLAPARPANRTGLPDGLKSSVESLAGVSLDGVEVHYNSHEPARLQALAYTRGSEIHLAPGQERHLPHEAWHAAQQAQGRVQATAQLEGMGLNDDAALEAEADVMGARSIRSIEPAPRGSPERARLSAGAKGSAEHGVVQRRRTFAEDINATTKSALQSVLDADPVLGAMWQWIKNHDDIHLNIMTPGGQTATVAPFDAKEIELRINQSASREKLIGTISHELTLHMLPWARLMMRKELEAMVPESNVSSSSSSTSSSSTSSALSSSAPSSSALSSSAPSSSSSTSSSSTSSSSTSSSSTSSSSTSSAPSHGDLQTGRMRTVLGPISGTSAMLHAQTIADAVNKDTGSPGNHSDLGLWSSHLQTVLRVAGREDKHQAALIVASAIDSMRFSMYLTGKPQDAIDRGAHVLGQFEALLNQAAAYGAEIENSAGSDEKDTFSQNITGIRTRAQAYDAVLDRDRNHPDEEMKLQQPSSSSSSSSSSSPSSSSSSSSSSSREEDDEERRKRKRHKHSRRKDREDDDQE